MVLGTLHWRVSAVQMPSSAARLNSHQTHFCSETWSLGTPVCAVDYSLWRGDEEQSLGKGTVFPVGFQYAK